MLAEEQHVDPVTPLWHPIAAVQDLGMPNIAKCFQGFASQLRATLHKIRKSRLEQLEQLD